MVHGGFLRGVKLKLGCVFRREECATLRINQDFSRNGADILPLLSHVHASPHRTNPRQPLVTSAHIWELSQQLPRIITSLCGASPSPHDWSASKHLPWPLLPRLYFTGPKRKLNFFPKWRHRTCLYWLNQLLCMCGPDHHL